MKRIILLLLMVSIISGCGQKEMMDDRSAVVDTPPVDSGVMDTAEVPVVEEVLPPADVKEEIALMDRNKYLTGGKEGYDTAKVYFTQKMNKGFSIKVETMAEAVDDAAEETTGKNLEVNVMTDKNCMLLDQEEEFEIIETKQGSSVEIVSSETMEEDQNICISVKAIDEGEMIVHIVVNELSF